MAISIICGVCKETCVFRDDAAGKMERCPNGHLVAVPAGARPALGPAGPAEAQAGTASPARKTGVKKTSSLARGSRPAGVSPAPRPSPATGDEDGKPASKRHAGLALVVVLGGFFFLLLMGGAGVAVWVLLHPPGSGQVVDDGATPPSRTASESALRTEEPGAGSPAGGRPQKEPREEGPKAGPGVPPRENGGTPTTPESGERSPPRPPEGSGDRPPAPGKPEGSEPKPPDPPMRVVDDKGKLDLRKLDKLDLSTLDVRLPPPKPDDRPPDVWDGHTNHVRCVAVTDDGQFVVSVSGDLDRDVVRPPDNSIRVWDARRGRQLHKVEGFKEALDSLSLSRGGRFALFSHGGYWQGDRYIRTKDYGVYMWDIQSKKAIRLETDEKKAGEKATARFLGLRESVFTTAISPDRKTVAAADASGGVIFWDTESAKPQITGKVSRTSGFLEGVRATAFTPDGRYLVIAHGDNTLRLHGADNGEPVCPPLRSHLDIVWGIDVAQTRDGGLRALSGGGARQRRDGRGFEPGARDHAIRLWDLDRKTVIRRFEGHEKPVLSVAFCPNQRHFVSCAQDKTVRLWDLETGKELRLLGRHEGAVNSVAVAPDGRSCVSGGYDCKVRFWSLPTGLDLVDAISKNDLGAFKKAAADMDVIGPDAAVALTWLVKALGREDAEFRALAVQVLSRLAERSGPKGPPFEASHVPGLIKALDSAGPAEAWALAAWGLGLVGPEARESAQALVKALASKREARAASAAAEALGKIGIKTPEALAALQKGLEHEEGAVRMQCLQVLGQLAPEKLTVEALLDRLQGESSVEVQEAADRTLRHKFPALTARDVPALRRGLKASRVRACLCSADAVAALKADGAEAAPELAALLLRPEQELRLAGLRGLRALGEGGKQTVPELAKVVQAGKDKETAIAATVVLARLDPGNPVIATRGIPLLLEGLKPSSEKAARAALADPLDGESAKTLLEMGEPVIKPLFQSGLKDWLLGKATKDISATVARYQAYKLLEELARRASSDEKLREALQHWERELRLTYVSREGALVKQAKQQALLGRLSQEDVALYEKTQEAARAALNKVAALPYPPKPKK